MRTFDDFEKGLLRQLKIYYENGILQNWISLLDGFLENKEIKLNRNQNTVTIGFDYNIYGLNNQQARNLIDDVNEITIVIVKTIFLLQYLEKNGYVFLFNESGNNLNGHSRISSNNPPISHQIPDADVCKLIIEYFSKTIVISQAIVDLVNDNFISKEEQRHNETIRVSSENLVEARRGLGISEDNLAEAKKGIKISRFAVGVAIVIGAASIVMSTTSIWQTNQTSEKPIVLDSMQYERLIIRFNSLLDNQALLNQTVDSIKNKPNIDLTSIHLRLDNIKKEIKKLNTIKPSR